MNYFYLIVFIVFQLSFIIQLYYTLIVHRRLTAFKSQENNLPKHPVSVVICARNEQKNLIQNLPGILEQKYPDFEVVVVNDCSIDDSDLVLRELSAQYSHLRVVTINEHERFKHGKKFAATLGIKAAKNEHLLFTDSDCRPSSPNWLAQMQSNFNGTTQIVLGYSPYEKLSGLVNKIIRFETFFTALNYLSFALVRKPYMGVGRNLAYTKSLFFQGKGFASHMHILSGDDDLFVNQHANADNTVIEIHSDAQVWSEPKKTLAAYIKQKLRHQGAGKAYKKAHKQMLSMQAGSAILFYITLAILVALQAPWWFLLGIYVLRLISQIFVYYPVLKKLSYADLIWWLPVFDIIYYFYTLALSIIILFKKKIEWK
ncbi:MAG TPA: glycosyltransferase [Daejeonella sp.]|nr:glycosyltransferase [Daejeonella sp.]